MPAHLRALVVILVLATAVFLVVRRHSAPLVEDSDYLRRRNFWYLTTLSAFLASSFWLYVSVISVFLVLGARRERNPSALFFMLFLAVPHLYVELPGLGLVNTLFTLSPQRLLVLVILLPALLRILQSPQGLRFGRPRSDLFITLYVLLVVSLNLRDNSVTDTMRVGFYQITDVLIPYFVVSRILIEEHRWRETVFAFVMAAMVLAPIAVFEASRHWLLYNSLVSYWGIPQDISMYIQRSGLLRASGSPGIPIALGYVMAVAIGLYLYLGRYIESKFWRRSGMLLLCTGLVAALSRGPWVGAAAMVIVFVATGPNAMRRLMTIGLAGVSALFVISLLPGGQSVINLVPFIGETETGTIDYREMLFENSLQVIGRNLWLGSTDYLETPEMEAMRQGQGIIDIVNTYLRVALETGVIGLGLFAGTFLNICWGLRRHIRRSRNRDLESVVFSRALLATLIGIMLTIFTVSSVRVIPLIYWSIAGMGAGFLAHLDRKRQQATGPLPDTNQ